MMQFLFSEDYYVFRTVAALNELEGGEEWGVGKASEPQKNVAHHGWPTEKVLVFKWAKTTQMTLKLFRFSGTF